LRVIRSLRPEYVTRSSTSRAIEKTAVVKKRATKSAPSQPANARWKREALRRSIACSVADSLNDFQSLPRKAGVGE
jgi:hypothetical protein